MDSPIVGPSLFRPSKIYISISQTYTFYNIVRRRRRLIRITSYSSLRIVVVSRSRIVIVSQSPFFNQASLLFFNRIESTKEKQRSNLASLRFEPTTFLIHDLERVTRRSRPLSHRRPTRLDISIFAGVTPIEESLESMSTLCCCLCLKTKIFKRPQNGFAKHLVLIK